MQIALSDKYHYCREHCVSLLEKYTQWVKWQLKRGSNETKMGNSVLTAFSAGTALHVQGPHTDLDLKIVSQKCLEGHLNKYIYINQPSQTFYFIEHASPKSILWSGLPMLCSLGSNAFSSCLLITGLELVLKLTSFRTGKSSIWDLGLHFSFYRWEN